MPLNKVFSKEKKTCSVTFTIPKESCPNAQNVHIVGDFNSWSATETPLKKQKDGSFSVTLDLPIDSEVQFRYLYDGLIWKNDSMADKYYPAFCGGVDNSVVVTKSS